MLFCSFFGLFCISVSSFLVSSCCVFFFFKQKTACEVRISDWSSDVCSSDLPAGQRGVAVEREVHGRRQQRHRQDAATDRFRWPSVQLLPVRRLRPHAVCPLRTALLIDHNVATQEGPLGPSSFSSRNPTPPTMHRNIAAAGPIRELLETQSRAMPPQSAEQHACAMRSIVDARQRCFSLSRQGCAGLQPFENMQRQTPVRRHRPDPVRAVLFSAAGARSEEHTSELQSLMRISYAVFCLNKKRILTN